MLSFSYIYTMLKSIKYKNKRINVLWIKPKDCLAVYDPNQSSLIISPNLSKVMLGKVIFHELWHIICVLNKSKIIDIGEERTAILSEQFAVILKKNPKLKQLTYSCLK